MKKSVMILYMLSIIGIGSIWGQQDYNTNVVFTSGLCVPLQITSDSIGNLYVANHSYAGWSGPYTNSVAKIDTLGNKTIFVSGYKWPSGIAMDNQQNLYFSQNNASSKIIKVTPKGIATTFVSLTHQPGPITLFDNNNPDDFRIYSVSHWGSKGIVTTFSDATQSIFNTGSHNVCQISNDGQYLFVNSNDNSLILRFKTSDGSFENWVTSLRDCSLWASTIGPDNKLYVIAKSVSDTTKKAVYKINGFNNAVEVINNMPKSSELNDLVFVKRNNKYDLFITEIVEGNRTDSASNRVIKFSAIDIEDICHQTVYDTIYVSVTDTLIINAMLTGIKPPNNSNIIKIYPNPANTHIYINTGDYLSMNGYTIQILNSVGQTVYSSIVNQPQYFIDLSSWSGHGVYFIYILDYLNNVIEVRKIILQ